MSYIVESIEDVLTELPATDTQTPASVVGTFRRHYYGPGAPGYEVDVNVGRASRSIDATTRAGREEIDSIIAGLTRARDRGAYVERYREMPDPAEESIMYHSTGGHTHPGMDVKGVEHVHRVTNPPTYECHQVHRHDAVSGLATGSHAFLEPHQVAAVRAVLHGGG
jgi:hypothetical protein